MADYSKTPSENQREIRKAWDVDRININISETGEVTGGPSLGDPEKIFATGSTTPRSPADRWGDVSNVKDFGATGLNVVNDHSAIQQALDAAPQYGAVFFPPGTYKIEDELFVNQNADIRIFGYGAKIRQATADKNIFNITKSGVHIEGLTLVGVSRVDPDEEKEEIAINAEGADVNNHISDILVRDCTITTWGDCGINLEFVEKFSIENNRIEDCYSRGIVVRSGRHGQITSNRITGIIADGSVGTNAYGIQLSKSTGTEAVKPVCRDIVVSGNYVSDVRTWEGIDTHGGTRIVISDNVINDARTGIALVPYTHSADSAESRGPSQCTVTGNTVRLNHGAGELVTTTNAMRGIIVAGGYLTEVKQSDNVISSNYVDGYGDSDTTPTSAGSAAVEFQYGEHCIISDNIINNSGVHGILLSSLEDLSCTGNIITTLAGAAASAPTSTITFASNPTGGDTITIGGSNEAHGAVFTFEGSPSGAFEILIGADLEATMDNAIVKLNTNTDGRVSLATYTETATQIIVTYDRIGREGDSNFSVVASNGTVSTASPFTDATCITTLDPTVTMTSTLALVVGMPVTGTGIPIGATVASIHANETDFELSAAATVASSPSTVTLTFNSHTMQGGTTGASGIILETFPNVSEETSPGHAGSRPACTGLISNNTANVGAHIAFASVSTQHDVHWRDNVSTGTGPLYDLKHATSITPNGGAGIISPLVTLTVARDLASIAAGASESFYVPIPGVSGYTNIFVTTNRELNGLSISTHSYHNYILVEVFNPTAGAIDLADTDFRFSVEKLSSTPVTRISD